MAEQPLTPDDPMIVLGYRCLRRAHDVLLARQPQRGTAPSTDDVHQMRIATRRLRVALRLFAHMLPHRAASAITRELRWFASALGNVRDLDVYAGTLRNYVRSAAADAEQLGGYELHVRRERTLARGELAELFASERYTRLLASFDKLLEGAPSAGALRRWQSFKVRDGAKSALKRSRKRVRKLGDKLGSDARANDLHRLRIRAKRLRYELEFFLEAYPHLASAAKATKALQDVLGDHQDACTAATELARYHRKLRAEKDGSAAPPVPALDRWRTSQKQKAAAARKAWPAEWNRFVTAIDDARQRAL